jgi:hypothetical protein
MEILSSSNNLSYVVNVNEYKENGELIEVKTLGYFKYINDAKLYVLAMAQANNVNEIDDNKKHHLPPLEIFIQNENKTNNFNDSCLITINERKLKNNLDNHQVKKDNENSSYFFNILNWFIQPSSSSPVDDNNTYIYRKYELSTSNLLSKSKFISKNEDILYCADEVFYLLSSNNNGQQNELIRTFVNDTRMMNKLSLSLEHIYNRGQKQKQKIDDNINKIKNKCEDILKPENFSKVNNDMKIFGYAVMAEISKLQNNFSDEWYNWNLAAIEENLFAIYQITKLRYRTKEYEKANEWCEKGIKLLLSSLSKANENNKLLSDFEYLKSQIIQSQEIQEKIQNISIDKWAKFSSLTTVV